MALLNFKYGVQSNLPAKAVGNAGNVYITTDTKKMFVELPKTFNGTEVTSTEQYCISDFQLVNWTKNDAVTSPISTLESYSLLNTNTLYITVESASGATAMWRYVGGTTAGQKFKAISNSEEIANIVDEIDALKSRANTLERKVVHSGISNTASATATKIVTATNLEVYIGALLAVSMRYSNTANNPSLNVNNSGARPIRYNNANLTQNSAYNWDDYATVLFIYTGTSWDIVDSGALTKAETARALAAAALPKSGGTMTNFITLHADPTSAMHAVTKQYVDSAVEEINTNADNLDKKFADYMPLAGGTFSGSVDFAADATLTVNTPTEDGHAATKAYVDTAESDALDAAKQYTDTAKTAILGEAGYAGTVKGAYAAAEQAATAASNANDNAESRLPKKNPTVAEGALTLAVETPTAKMHAASKSYVDTQDTATLNSAKEYTNTRETAILGTNSDGTNYSGTIKGAYGAAEAASTAAQTAQERADDAYELADGKTTMAQVQTKIESYGYATVAVAEAKANDAESNANDYTDDQIADVNSTIDSLKEGIQNLSNIMNFLGTTNTVITDGTTTEIEKPSAITDDTYTAATGDVVVDKDGKECVYDGSVWRVIGDTSANSTAITNLQNTVGTKPSTPAMEDTLWEEVADLRTDLGETNDPKTKTTTAFGRIANIEDWISTHSTQYNTLDQTVNDHESRIDVLEGWKVTHSQAYDSLVGRVDALEAWKTSHAIEYSALVGRVDALEQWKEDHSTAFEALSSDVSDNTDAIDALTLVLTWGTF